MRGALLIVMMAWLALAARAEEPRLTGKTDFESLCAPCHGLNALGDGPASTSLKIPPADLTEIAKRHGGTFPRNYVFDTIAGIERPVAHGTREMPVWGNVFIDEAVGSGTNLDAASQAAAAARDRIAALVDYLESIQER